MKIAELLSDESKWCKGSSAKDVNGWMVHPESSRAVCYCLSGAIARCYPGELEEQGVRGLIAAALRESGMPNGAIAPWNDSKSTTFADVRALVERLAI